MKQTLLELTQNILSALNGNEVNSISDTTESMQVATCIQTTYFNMMSKYELPEHEQISQLIASGNGTQPTLMYRPEGTGLINWIKYFDSNPNDGASLQQDQYGAYNHDLNLDIVTSSSTGWSTSSTSSNTIGLGSKTFTVSSGLTGIVAGQGVNASSGANSMSGTVTSYSGTTLIINITSVIGSGTYTSWIIQEGGRFGPGYLYVKMLTIEDFLSMTQRFDPSESNVGSFTLTSTNGNTSNPETFTFFYKNDAQPRFCTIIQNNFIVFDSYDKTQDSTLQASKTMVSSWVLPTFSMTDSFIPNLDDNMFPLLLNEAKSLAFFELKQTPHQKAEQEVQRQLSSLQKFKAVSNKPTYFDQLPNFGRTGRGFI